MILTYSKEGFPRITFEDEHEEDPPRMKFEDLHFPEECDTSFLTPEEKQILVDVREQAVMMRRRNLEDWIVLPYYELIKYFRKNPEQRV